MAASINDKFLKVGVAGTLTTLQSPGKALAAASITVGSTTNWPTDTGVLFAIRVVDANGDLVAGTYTEWVGTVSGTTISGLTGTPAYGTDQVYAAGSTTQVYIPVSAYAQNRLIDGILVEHDQDGTHGTVTATSVTTTGAITAGSGFTVSGGSVTLPAGSIETADLADGAVTNAKVATGAPVQVVSAGFSAVATGTTVFPLDDTIPQITEGNEYMTLAITPKSATNILVITATGVFSSSIANNNMIMALFQDATANALAVAIQRTPAAADTAVSVPLLHTMVAGTASATTFRIRASGNGAGTTTFNGNAGARLFGAIPKSTITITEYKA